MTGTTQTSALLPPTGGGGRGEGQTTKLGCLVKEEEADYGG